MLNDWEIKYKCKYYIFNLHKCTVLQKHPGDFGYVKFENDDIIYVDKTMGDIPFENMILIHLREQKLKRILNEYR